MTSEFSQHEEDGEEEDDRVSPLSIFADITDTNGYAYTVWTPSAEENLKGMHVRRLTIGNKGQTVLDLHVDYPDMHFLTVSLVTMLLIDTESISKIDNFILQWSANRKAETIDGMRKAAGKLLKVADLLEQVRFSEPRRKPDALQGGGEISENSPTEAQV